MTTAPVAATATATGPPASAAAARRDAVVFVPVTASGTTGQPPGVCSNSTAAEAG
ncbi:hypothetical protein ACFXOS_07085 [Streptomyces sp. NPDC059175]|uniref:hypothetical protein n=1 Tax=Streptomyces sp. NPDC059175 TaxID=3346757 RepID=UPI0036C4A58D